LAGEIEAFGENLLQCHFVHHIKTCKSVKISRSVFFTLIILSHTYYEYEKIKDYEESESLNALDEREK
jgi:hypothetical protein